MTPLSSNPNPVKKFETALNDVLCRQDRFSLERLSDGNV